MLKPVTITLADVKALHPTAELDGAVLEPHIQKAQDLDLRPVLGDVLYYDFMSKFLVTGDASYAIYQTLLNGGSYTYAGNTIYFDGLKPFMVCKTLVRLAVSQPAQLTRFGFVTKVASGSQPVDKDTIRMFVNGQNSDAQTYQNNICQYLNNNVTTYTKFKGEQTSLKTGFKMFNGSYNRDLTRY